MNMFRPSTFLRRVLVADAATGAACGLLMVLAQGPLSGLLGLPVELLHYAGLALLPFAVLLLLMALGEALPPAAVWAVIVVNAGWAFGCLLLLTALGGAHFDRRSLPGGADRRRAGLRRARVHGPAAQCLAGVGRGLITSACRESG